MISAGRRNAVIASACGTGRRDLHQSRMKRGDQALAKDCPRWGQNTRRAPDVRDHPRMRRSRDAARRFAPRWIASGVRLE
jgi:hypothetical protein